MEALLDDIAQLRKQPFIESEQMKFSEVIEKIGRPHLYGITGIQSFRWISESGKEYAIQFFLSEKTPDNVRNGSHEQSLWAYYHYGIAF